jgi:putative acetyltransferase
MSYIIRQVTLQDLDGLLTVFTETIRRTCQRDYSEEQRAVWASSAKDTEKWLKCIRTQYFLAAELDDQIVGFASLGQGYYIDFMYVHPGFLRRGIAHQLFVKLQAEANRQGHRALVSDVSITARPFFESKGFRVVRENVHVREGVELINFRMVKGGDDWRIRS